MKDNSRKNFNIIEQEYIQHDLFENLDFSSSDEQVDVYLTSVKILPLQSNVLFPNQIAPIALGRDSSLKVCQEAMENNEAIFIIAQKDSSDELPSKRELYRTGVIGHILDIITMPDESHTLMVKSGHRANLDKIVSRKKYLKGNISFAEDEILPEDIDKLPVAAEMTKDSFKRILSLLDEKETAELRKNFEMHCTRPLFMLNFICNHAPLDVNKKAEILECDNVLRRFSLLNEYLGELYNFMKVREEIQKQAAGAINRNQRDHFLQQQMKIIQDELGDSVEDQDAENLDNIAETKKWSNEARDHYEKEMHKLERFNVQNPEYAIQYGYLETFVNLPWDNLMPSDIEVQEVRRVLDEDHYGLESVKERILEQVAIMKLRGDMKAPIICLYGPPGVGKTSLGKSIARAMNREYRRISLGGVHDEAEIRGHRRTYIGAMPGRIMNALKGCKTNNPVFVLDEIDKIGKDFKGDPSTALLEVLDPEQNNKFHDNYIDFDYNLSKVIFIATANDLSTISRPLLDRMELIEMSGYVPDEKKEIAQRHLIPKVLDELGFEKEEIRFTGEAIEKLISGFTRESGVRMLEKQIAKLLRKVALKKASYQDYPREITPEIISVLMGADEFRNEEYENNDYTGVVTGLAWTQVGGEILLIETSLSNGKGEKLTLTGNLGDVMKESAMIALQYLKAHAADFGIDIQQFAKHDVHIHVPEGAIPKDGPSAGITMTTALASAFSGRKVKEKLAMTGEMTLRGKVLPVGGIKEKILAAKRAGITDIILSKENRRDIEKIPQEYLDGLTFHYVTDIKEVLEMALI